MENNEEKKELVKDNVTPVEIPEMAKSETQADFSSMFGIASEEKVEVPKEKEIQPENEEVTTEEPEQKVEKKPSEFNGQEKVLYEIKPEKESSPVVPALFFALLISVIFLLPYVSKHIDFSLIKPAEVASGENGEETDEFYFFNKSSVRAKLGDLEFTNFVKSHIDGEYRISFNITNTAMKTYQFNQNYFVVLYDKNERVVFRSLIYSHEAIGAMAAQSITLNITAAAYNKSEKFKIEQIPKSTYPKVKLLEKEGEYEVLTCTYINNTIKYYFKDNSLEKIHDEYKEKNTSDNTKYQENLVKYRNLSSQFKEIANFNSVFIESSSDFHMINDFELKKIPDAQIKSLRTYRFFSYNETIDVISFELESQAYTCS